MTDLGPTHERRDRRGPAASSWIIAVVMCVVVGSLVGLAIGGGGVRAELSCAVAAFVGVAIGVWLVGTSRALTGPTTGPVPEPSWEVRQEIDQEVARGRTIEAIKLYREATGSGLREAKSAIDSWQPGH